MVDYVIATGQTVRGGLCTSDCLNRTAALESPSRAQRGRPIRKWTPHDSAVGAELVQRTAHCRVPVHQGQTPKCSPIPPRQARKILTHGSGHRSQPASSHMGLKSQRFSHEQSVHTGSLQPLGDDISSRRDRFARATVPGTPSSAAAEFTRPCRMWRPLHASPPSTRSAAIWPQTRACRDRFAMQLSSCDTTVFTAVKLSLAYARSCSRISIANPGQMGISSEQRESVRSLQIRDHSATRCKLRRRIGQGLNFPAGCQS